MTLYLTELLLKQSNRHIDAVSTHPHVQSNAPLTQGQRRVQPPAPLP